MQKRKWGSYFENFTKKKKLNEQGYSILCFNNEDVMEDIYNAGGTIENRKHENTGNITPDAQCKSV